MRPFHTVDDIERKMVRRSGVTSKLFENYKDLLKGYRAVDAVLQRCEKIGQDTDAILEIWQKFSTMPRPEKEETLIHLVDDPSPTLSVEMSPEERKIMDRYIWDPPKSLAKDVTLKEYQMLGLNWLHLLYSRGHSCILADEMG
jgi:SWI/SNF-related matrix-associated actin-dependent regulator 1 of chromatin subfamily A